MNNDQRGLNVLPLPAELRLEIYRCLVRRFYLAVITTPENCMQHPDWQYKRPVVPRGLVILRVSKDTSREALDVLYNESVFVFKLDFATPFPYDIPPEKGVAEMRNVCFELSAKTKRGNPITMQPSYFLPKGAPSRQELMTQRSIALFTDFTPLRKLVHIRFKDCISMNPYCMPDSFGDAMTELWGFQKLVVQLDFPHTLRRGKPMSGTECDLYKDRFLDEDFEPAYGPAVQHAVRGAEKDTWFLGFKPYQSLRDELLPKEMYMVEAAARFSG